ncbi:MAG TPA: hypothetical protein VE988_23705 [Gemmataceae bacterium]|nr:hypothetical protein [Gemmataceae bacterium]
MITILATIQNGQIVPRQPVDWPEGTEVEVSLIKPKGEKLGMTEDEWPTTPEGIAALLKRMDEAEPLEFTPEEEKAWEDDRKARREFELNNFDKRSKMIEGLFE